MHQIPKFKVSPLVMQLFFCNIWKPGVKSGMRMLQLHLNDQQFYCLLRCVLYQRFDSKFITNYACHCLKLPKWISLNFMWLKWIKSYKNTSLHLSCLLFYVQTTTTYSSKGLLLINQSTHFLSSLSSYRARIEYLDAYMHISNGVNTLLPLNYMIYIISFI